jgi:hypothetical protein
LTQSACSLEGACDLRELGVDESPISTEEGVRESELVDASPLPGIPCGIAPVGRRGRVPLQEGHLMPVLRQEHGGTEPDDAAAHDKYVSHDDPFLGEAGRLGLQAADGTAIAPACQVSWCACGDFGTSYDHERLRLPGWTRGIRVP